MKSIKLLSNELEGNDFKISSSTFERNISVDRIIENMGNYSREEVLGILDKFLESIIKGEKTGLTEEWFDKNYGSKGSEEVELPKHPSVISENENELLFDKEGNLIKELPKQPKKD